MLAFKKLCIMNKIRQFIISFCVLSAIVSCNDLDLPSINIIQDKDVFSTESGVTAYMTRLYKDLPIEGFKFNKDGFDEYSNYLAPGNSTGEYLLCMTDMQWESPKGEWWKCWHYGAVRNVNYFIATLPEYTGNFTETQVNLWLGEAYFIRAYYYFAMVKRYGGIPIIKEVQNFPEQSMEELRVPRNTEKEVYDFIEEELNEAIRLLPDESPMKGRVNKFVAYALKSKAMLYAASIAEYGQIQLEGILGIPSNEAQGYYQKSYDASVALAGRYSLYNKYEDKAENYWRLFLDEDSPENIFCEYYKYPEKVHSFDAHNIPYQQRGAAGYSSRLCPTLEIVEMFDDINGESGVLKVNDENNKPIRFANVSDIFKNVEPRLRGTVILPGDDFKGEAFEVQKGLYPTYSETAKPLISTSANDLYEGKRIIGRSGIGHQEMTSTGFCMRKYQNPAMSNADVIESRSAQFWIDMRYAEVLLNKAEAAFSLGKKEEALLAINEIRNRAGAKPYAIDKLTMKEIQKERRLELAFENQTYWDLRRWRIADKEINNTQFTSLCPYYIYDEQKYIFKKEKVGGQYTFDVKVNYEKIDIDEISKNNKLIQNPGY